MLYKEAEKMFPKGTNGTSISDLTRKLINGSSFLYYIKLGCKTCKTEVSLDPPDNLIYIH